jgi:hypothetical protein
MTVISDDLSPVFQDTAGVDRRAFLVAPTAAIAVYEDLNIQNVYAILKASAGARQGRAPPIHKRSG